MSDENKGVDAPALTHGTITVGQLVDASAALQRLSQVPLRGATALRLARLLRAALPEIQTFEKARMALFESLGEQVEEGWRIKPENVPDFTAQVVEMRAVPLSLPCVKLSLNELGENAITPGDLMVLEWLFAEE